MLGRTAIALTALAFLAGRSPAQTMRAIEIADGVVWPTWIGMPPDDATRLFVAETNRGVRVIENGFVLPDRFLDLTAILPPTGEGLTALAFDPEHAQNGYLYTMYQDANSMSWISRWATSVDPNLADPSSEEVLIGPYPQPDLTTHNFNCMTFGPDSKLWAATGDGGFPFDPMNLSQDLSSLHGKLLRLDPFLPPPYVPADNPFVGVPGVREEIWAYGLRQPWRVSFDRETRDLWIAEVGQASWEEIDFQPAASAGGENYGWRCLEGTHCTGLSGCDCGDPSLTAPVHEYPHSGSACAIIGGYRYRGAAIPSLQGRYVFGDFCGSRLTSAAWDGVALSDFVDHSAEIQPCAGSAIGPLTTYGEDLDGELYLGTSGTGRVYKIVPEGATAITYCASYPNSTGDAARIAYQGTTSVSADDLVLSMTDAPANRYALFYYGTARNDTPFGNGVRCVGGTTYRLGPAQLTDSNGDLQRPLDIANPPPGGQITPGSRWHFQCWYRDPAGGGAGFNLSDALTVEFCP